MANAVDTQILYLAYFARAADPSGFLYWTTGPQGALPLNEVADYFAQGEEYKQATAGLNAAQTINAFYVNLFGRPAEQTGLNYWLLRTQPGDNPGESKIPGEALIDIQDVGYFIALGALDQSESAPDRVVLESKLAAADKWTEFAGADPVANENYNGSLANTYGVDFLRPVVSPDTIPSDADTTLALDRLPPFGTVGLVKASSESVTEGSSVTFTVTTVPSLAGQDLVYELTGIQSADVGVSLAGTIRVSATGVAVLNVPIAADALIETGEILGISFPNQSIFAKPPGSDFVEILDTTIPNLQVQASATAVSEGGVLTFTITSTNLAVGTEVAYDLSGAGLTPVDVNGAPLAGTVVLNASQQAQVTFNISADLSTEGAETVFFTAEAAGVTAGAQSVINDTSVTPPTPVLPTSFLLTTDQDIAAGTAVPLISFIGNEQTLGQGDRLSKGEALEAVLEVDVAGAFNLNNFSTDGVLDLVLNGDGVQAVGDSSVAMSNTDIANIFISKAIQNDVLFDDIQFNALFVDITDSIGDFEFNFDASFLNTGRQFATVVLDEIPIDAGLEGVGIYFSQANNNAQAKLEELYIGSFNSSGDDTTNLVNLIRKISVGDALDTLGIFGTTNLDIENDLGLPGSFANPFITLIDAEGLDADLSLAYTTQVQDAVVPNDTPDVTVTGAQGDNILTFASTGAQPADFGVTTFDGADSIITTSGDDTVDAGEGDNGVNAGEGQNSVFAGNDDNTVFTGSGDDFVDLGNGDNFVDAGDGDNGVFVGDGDNEIFTGSDDDFIEAGTGNNEIFAGDGDNTVNAGVGVDPFGTGSNKVITGSGVDIVNTGDGADTIVVGDDADFSADLVNSNGGADLVITGNGDDVVNAGSGNDNVAVGEGTVTVDLGTGSDALWTTANNLEGDDFINGGEGDAAGVRDAIIFTAGGTILRSETEGVTNIEEFVLRNLEADPIEVSDHPDVQEAFEDTVGGLQADYDLALSNALVDGSNDLTGSGPNAVRRFTVNAANADADVTLDLTPVSSRDAQRNLIGITYVGSDDGYTEKLIVSDQQLNTRLIADFDNGFGNVGVDPAGDILEILDTTDATVADLRGISGLDVIQLDASVNTAQTFTITLDQAFIDRNAGPSDPIIIRATNGLPPGSRLNLDVSAVTSAGLTRSIVVEKTSNLNVIITGDPLLGQAGAKVQVVDAFFLTSNSDDINGTIDDDLIIVDSADDLNPSDNINGGAAFDTMLFEFGVADGQVEFGDEFTETTGYVALLGAYEFDASGSQMMLPDFMIDITELRITPSLLVFDFEGLPIITEAITQVTNLLSTPVPVDPNTFEGIQVDGNFVSSSQPDFPEGVAIGGLPFPGYVIPTGQTLESQLDFIRVENVERYVFNPTNDNGVRFVGFNSIETFETPGFFDGNPAFAQQGQLDLQSLEILQTFDSNRSPNAGAPFALIEGNGAPLNDILFLDDFSWDTDTTTKAEAFWDTDAQDDYVIQIANFNAVGFQADYDFSLYTPVAPPNNEVYGSFFDSDDDESEAPQQRRSAGSTDLDFALEVNTGAGNDYIFRTLFGESSNDDRVGQVVSIPVDEDDDELHYLAGYLVDSGSGDDVVVMDDPFYAIDPRNSTGGIEQYGLFGGYNRDSSGNDFYLLGNPFYDASGNILPGEFAFEAYADDVILTRSGNDFVVDYGGDNIVYSGIGNDFVLTGYGNDFIISDDDEELAPTVWESEIGAEAIAGPASTDATDNDIVNADGPLVGSFLQFNPEYDDNVPGSAFAFLGQLIPGLFGNAPGSEFAILGQVSPGVFGLDYVRDLTGDNIISTGGNADTVITGEGDDIVLAGSIGDLDPSGGVALYNDSDVINDLGGHNLIVTLGDSDYIESGDGSDVILAGFGNDDDVVFAGGGSDLIEFAGGDDYIDAGAGNDFMASLLGADDKNKEGSILSLLSGDWNGLTNGDTILGGDGFDSLLLAFGGSDDDTVIAPRLVLTSNADGVPTTVSAPPNPGSYPPSYEDDAVSVNPIMDSVETLILFSDDADIYLTDTVAKQAKNLVEVAPGVFANQVSVFLNDLEYDGIGSGVDIVLDASAFEADSSLRAFAFNIGASNLQRGITGSAGLIGGSGIDYLAAGSFLESGILAGDTDIASLLVEISSFLDNQALDNFVGADISTILAGLTALIGNGVVEEFPDLLESLFTQIAEIFDTEVPEPIRNTLPNYPFPGLDTVAQVQAILDLISENLSGDFVEDFISYQGNGGGDFITLEPTVLLPNGDPLVNENTVEFVRYETIRDGANAGVAAGFDQVFNFNNTDTNLPFRNRDQAGEGVNGGTITNSFDITQDTTIRSRVVASTKNHGDITGDKIVFGGDIGQVGDIISKNGNQLVDLFKVNQAVNWNTGRFTNVFDETGELAGQFVSGDEALFVDAAIQVTNDQITNFSSILSQINSFGTEADLNQGGLIVVNGGDKAIYAVYQELDGITTNIAQSEVSILGLVQGIDTNSFRLQASDFIIDNGFVTYEEGEFVPEPVTVLGSIIPPAPVPTPELPTSGNIWDAQPVTDPFNGFAANGYFIPNTTI